MRTVTRRAFLASGGAMLAVPFATHAQPAGRVYRLGYLTPTAPETFGAAVFRQALRDLGWVEGRNLRIDYRSADGKFERLPGLAAELIRLKPDLIVAIATVSALAAQKTTSDIPIVFAYVSDAVGSGLVEGLARPAANVTGLTHHNSSLNPKRLELLHHAVPNAAVVAGVWQPGGLGQHTEQRMLQETEAAATALGMRLRLVEARGEGDLDAAFAAASGANPDAAFVLPAPVFRSNARRVVQLVARGRLPTMYFGREFPDVGGLMSYGADMANILQGAASYVDRILKGARPSDLPVGRGSKFEFVINATTAKALGLTIPASLVARADQVIE